MPRPTEGLTQSQLVLVVAKTVQHGDGATCVAYGLFHVVNILAAIPALGSQIMIRCNSNSL